MSRDVITVGSTMRIPLLYHFEYSQWRERFMNNLEEQTDGEAMIHSITHGEYPLPVVTQVSLAGTAPNALPILKDPKFNDTAQELWDALERQMRGSEYGEQDRKAAILYEYETFKATEGEQLLDTYPLALVVEKIKVSKDREKVVVHSESEESDDEDISDLKKITTLLAKAINWKKYYVKPTNNNLRTSSASTSANKKPEYVKSEEKKDDKKEDEKKRDISKVNCYNCNKEGHFAKDCKKAKVKDYNYYKTKMLLAKKYNDEQPLLAEDHAWMDSSSHSDQELSVNMVFMAKMENILSDSEESSSSIEETIIKVSYYTSDSEKTFHDAIGSASENFDENHIVSQKDQDESEIDHNDLEEKDHLVHKLIAKFNQKFAKCQKRIEKVNKQNTYLEDEVMIDYALWEVIENGATLLKKKIMEGVMTEMPITTAEEKAQRRLEVKARSTLMMGIPNEHQLKFNSIKDAKKF
ncbi:RNA-directed DNA polymerase, eukaryota [Tanacetum coccineum]|uniref:RNA-directed DNA polymerase, eukaryota n=1 Tax=Tanacetum coccineum TaxID=301880 RepID=A0ABQ5J272_9ASTR